MRRVHWNAYKGHSCAAPSQFLRRERDKTVTNDPAKVTCQRCRKMFAAAMAKAVEDAR